MECFHYASSDIKKRDIFHTTVIQRVNHRRLMMIYKTNITNASLFAKKIRYQEDWAKEA